MNIKTEGDRVRVSELTPFVAQLLKMVPGAGQPSASKEAAARFFQEPGTDVEANREWKEFVHPELRTLFEAATDIVRADLVDLCTEDDPETNWMVIPLAHGDAWLNCLNRARLGLAATHHLTEEELTREFDGQIGSSRDLVLFQIHFYAVLQEVLVGAMPAE